MDADAVVLGIEQRTGVAVVADADRRAVSSHVVLDLLQQGALTFRHLGQRRRIGL
jgi:hypothetical protein